MLRSDRTRRVVDGAVAGNRNCSHLVASLVRSSFESLLKGKARLLGAAVGSGMTAAAAEEGGADFVLVLNAGYFRSQGIGSIAAFMPFANANELALRIARDTVIPRLRQTPTLVGVCAQDPSLDLDKHLKTLAALGAVGISNYPTVGLLDGPNRQLLESEGVTFAAEVKMLQEARARGFLTVGFCMEVADALALATAGVDMLCLNLGTVDRKAIEGAAHQADLDRALSRLRLLCTAVQNIRPDLPCIASGGPLLLPEDTAFVYDRAPIRGYLGGSPIERFPAAPAIAQTVREFKNAQAAVGRAALPRLGAIIGSSPAMQQVFESVRAVAATDATVLLIGESGTGKELVAHEIHRLSQRFSKPLVTWNCGAINESLAMSELFGHERGAFTGAARTHAGKFELAHGGTLFMDEVSELPLSVQAALLRVLQQREIVRVGGEKTIVADARVVAASNRDLADLVVDGRFRLDLYYRLSPLVIRVPPLRDRREDIPALIGAIGDELSQRYGRPAPKLSDRILTKLARHSWPGNIRELRNVVERSFLLRPGSGVSSAWMDEMLAEDQALGQRLNPGPALAPTFDAKRARLPEILARHAGSRTAAARELGISRKTVHKWLGQGPHKKGS